MDTGGTIDQLTERERQVFLMVVDGLANSAIAERLSISVRTVETHIRTVLRKMGVTRRGELISTYLREQNEQPARRGKMWLKETPRIHRYSDELQRMLDRGENDAAFQLVTRLVEVEPVWELVIDVLKIGEILGRPTDALRYAAAAEDALDGQPMSADVERAMWFYRARVLKDFGLYRYAIDFYRRNIPDDGKFSLGSHYQRQSRQGIAHIWFRVEDYGQAEAEIDRLYDELSDVLDPDLGFVADVLQYRGTLAMIGLVADLPFSAAREKPLDVSAADHYGAETLSISESTGTKEGIAWGHTVLAFAAEGREEFRRAEREYSAALRCFDDPRVRLTSKVQILLYKAGFERRRQSFLDAEDLVAEAATLVPADPSLLLRARLLEQQAELQRRRTGDDRAGAAYLDEAMRLYAHEPGLILFSDWPIVRRLRRTCQQVGLTFGSYFQLANAVGPEIPR
ncbi:MAG TPA: helix-turn-helix transcriptional regulator [Mycobacteriales bacterium]|nr:helix-turn-helix transcriptional regulator [Mycobacteriales bacterium]